MDNWKRVYSTTILHRAEIIKAVLEEKEIAAVILNKRDTSYPHGFYEVHVISDEVLRAVNIINNDIHFE